MLTNFFKLNGQSSDIKRIDDQFSFINLLNESASKISSIVYYPDTLTAAKQDERILKIKDKKFINCSFKSTMFENIQFTNCSFSDCLMMGTTFKQCKFIKCDFNDVNTKDIKFIDTYVDPVSFFYAIPSEPSCRIFIRFISSCLRCRGSIGEKEKVKNFANIGVQLYQSLLDNYKERSQVYFSLESEYHFRRWNSILHEYGYINRIEGYSFLGLMYAFLWRLVGYGIKIKSYVLTTATVFSIFCCVNIFFWEHYEIANDYDKLKHVLQYTFYSCLSIGATPFAATSMFGILLAMLQGVIGWLLLGVGIGIITKRLIG